MADLNSLIARGVQFQAPPDPFAQYAQMQQLQQGQQTNQLNQLKMQEYQRGVGEQNALRQLDPASPDYLAQVSRINPKTGFEFGKMQRESETAKITQQKSKSDLIDATLKRSRQYLDTVTTPEQYLAWHRANHQDPVLGPELEARGATEAKANASIMQALSQPGGFEQLLAQSKLGVEKFAEMNKPTLTSQNLGGTQRMLSTPGLGGMASVVPGSVGNVTMTPGQAEANRLAEARLAQGDRRLAGIEERAAAGPKPPDLKQVPVHAQKAILGAANSISELDRAIAAMEAPEGEDATGLKGYLPNSILQRAFPKGTEARAAVADIGSLILHDRSGAAVTAAEYPRQIPFIPSISDDKATVLKKLKRMRQIQMEDAEAMANTYTPEQGFREFKSGTRTPAPSIAIAAPGALSPAEQAELEELRKRFKK